MAQKYLCEFYTYKAKVPGMQSIVADPNTSLEYQIYSYVMAGNDAFFAGKYAAALNLYLAGWALLPKVFYLPWQDYAVSRKPEILLGIEMIPQLAAASLQLMKVRDLVDKSVPVVPWVDPPPELLEINQPFLGEDSKRTEAHELALAFLQSGELGQARAKAEELMQYAENDLAVRADAQTLLGAIDIAEGNFDNAEENMTEARRLFERMQQSSGVAAVLHNTAVALTKSGKAEEAGAMFASAASQAPQSMGWSVTHSINPGISAVNRSFGEAGLPIMVRDSQGAWQPIKIPPSAATKQVFNVFTANGLVQLDLNAGPEEITNKLLMPRVAATELSELESYYSELSQFISYLTHVGGFILPMALGDTYAALGDEQKALDFYLQARDYTYLNQMIERPMLWVKIAQIHITRGNRFYRDRNMAAARSEYEQIVRVLPEGGFSLTGALYTGGFAPYVAEHTAFLNTPDKLLFHSLDYNRRVAILEAFNSLTRIINNINYLGFSEDIVPIFSWRYLQNVARYLANHAIQAERAYVTFKETAEREDFTKLALKQAVDAQAAAIEVERLRIKAAREQLDAAISARNQAQVRLNNARAQRAQYASISRRLAALDEIMSFTNATGLGSDIRIEQDWATALGISTGTYAAEDLIQLLTRARSRLTQEFELANMDRQILEMQAALTVAQQQVEVAQAMLDIAFEQLDLAQLKLEQAQAQLEHFNAQEFTPELWNNLAQAQRDISQRYLDWAIGAAFLMERAFEFDYDTEVNRIRFDYERSELNGLLAADYLLVDIDSFTFDRIMEMEKQVPIKLTVSLADRYPSQFRDFQRTGRIDFEVLLQDVDQMYPGTCVRKLKRVEIVVEGLVGPRGLHGTLVNAGISHDRGRNGARKTRVQKPETMILSQFDLRYDGFVFTSDEEVLALFENAGPASGWVLEFRPESNDVDYRSITNIHLLMYFDAFYSDAAAEVVKAELAATATYQNTLGTALRHQYPDEFFEFRDQGRVTFTIDNAYLPFHHTNARIRDVYLVIETIPGGLNTGLVVRVSTLGGGFSGEQTTDANGMISSGDAAEPLNGMRDLSLADTWTIEIEEAANAAAFAAGFAWDKVANIYLFIDYEYVPRGIQVAADDFASDPMPNFDIVDDPQAQTNAPSLWSWDGPNQQVIQTSSIHNPPGNANLNTSPDKPGTYLVRKTDPQWPVLTNFVIRARLNSGNNNGIGLVFRYQDPDNFYYFLMDAQRNYRRLGKKVNGTFQDLQTVALDTNQGYAVSQDIELTVAVSGQAFKAYLDGQEILSGQDSSIASAGRVGFYAWNNPGVQFKSLSLEQI
jgi:tetratricopeptide (TPR) repeat protein